MELKAMRRVTSSMILLSLGLTVHSTLAEESGGGRDHLVRWYAMRGWLFPVLKIDGAYYLPRRGAEFPLKECPEGLELGSEDSKERLTIGFNSASNTYYFRMGQRDNMPNPKGWPEESPLAPTNKPPWLLDAKAEPPRAHDDFLGWYQSVWLPWIRMEIGKEGTNYFCDMQLYERYRGMDSWETEREPAPITPYSDGLGFVDVMNDVWDFAYNDALNRFELQVQGEEDAQPFTLRMPFARIEPPSSVESFVPKVFLGVPFTY
jgi:hypothetical protein